MLTFPNEYHPYAACLMYRGCRNAETVRANLPIGSSSEPPQPGAKNLPEEACKELMRRIYRAGVCSDTYRHKIIRDWYVSQVTDHETHARLNGANETSAQSAAAISESLRTEAATVKLGTCLPAGRFPEGVSRYNALMWAAELIDERRAQKASEPCNCGALSLRDCPVHGLSKNGNGDPR